MKILLNLQQKVDRYLFPRLAPRKAKQMACAVQLLILFAMVFDFCRLSVKFDREMLIFLLGFLGVGLTLSIL
jgi:hypothetical protein